MRSAIDAIGFWMRSSPLRQGKGYRFRRDRASKATLDLGTLGETRIGAAGIKALVLRRRGTVGGPSKVFVKTFCADTGHPETAAYQRLRRTRQQGQAFNTASLFLPVVGGGSKKADVALRPGPRVSFYRRGYAQCLPMRPIDSNVPAGALANAARKSSRGNSPNGKEASFLFFLSSH